MRPGLGKIMRWLAVAAIFFCVLEACARLDDLIKYRAPLVGVYSDDLLRTYDSQGIRCNIPHGGFEKWRNNSLGFRGPEIDQQPAALTTRIVCMGTSETYGLYESAENEWPAQLRRLLGDQGRYEVVNVSTVGLSMVRYIAYFESYVTRLSPDMVVLVVNPLTSAVRAAKNPGKEKTNPPRTTKRPAKPQPSPLPKWRIVPKITQMIKRFLPQGITEYFLQRDIDRTLSRLEAKYLKGDEPRDVFPAASLEQFGQEYAELLQWLKERDIEVLACSCPTMMDQGNLVEHQLLFNQARRFTVEYSLEGMLDGFNRGNRIMKTVAEEMGCGFIDMDRKIPKDPEHFGDYVHFTDAGARIFARETAQYVVNARGAGSREGH